MLRHVKSQPPGCQSEVTGLNNELEDCWGIRLATRTGVHTGEVVTGDPASGQRLVTGDAMNTAAPPRADGCASSGP